MEVDNSSIPGWYAKFKPGGVPCALGRQQRSLQRLEDTCLASDVGYIMHKENVRECVASVSESERATTSMTEAAFSFHPHPVVVELATGFIDKLCLIGLFYSAGILLPARLTCELINCKVNVTRLRHHFSSFQSNQLYL